VSPSSYSRAGPPADDPPPEGLLAELLGAPDRDRIPGAAPVVSVTADEDEAFLRALARRGARSWRLERRGSFHGTWAELAGERATASAEELAQRWRRARPIVLAGAASEHVAGAAAPIGRALERWRERDRPGFLARWLGEAQRDLDPEQRAWIRSDALADPERDLERCCFPGDGGADGERSPWLKLARLSTSPRDASLRARFGFGREGDDDAARDPDGHAAVARLAEALLPEARGLAELPALGPRLEAWTGGPVRLSQHIAYWNAPGGGALFHHDSFDEPTEDRQLGVCFVQLAGETAWLALSVDQLAARVAELAEYLVDGELPWVREALFGTGDGFVRFAALAADRGRLAAELARPGCGELASVVNLGPEFTGLLADGGHACVLHPGDVLLLPNRDPTTTAMHSVFCASDDVTYGLSMAVRSRFRGDSAASAGRAAALYPWR